MLTAISMFSPCTQWVFGPLSPVNISLVRGHRSRIKSHGWCATMWEVQDIVGMVDVWWKRTFAALEDVGGERNDGRTTAEHVNNIFIC